MISYFLKKKAISLLPKGNGQKVYVGVSGGVDSSVAAALLKDAGFDVTGVFIKVWHPDFLPCNWKDEMRDAMRVCAHLNIPFKMIDLSEAYKKGVIDYMVSEYEAGRTPNPDVMCNKSVKFGDFLKQAKEEGAEYIATGHYAYSREEDGNIKLFRGIDDNKDQTYFLWTLLQDQLRNSIFPVGYFKKSSIRRLAKEYGLPTASKKDSQGLCFIGHVDVKEFLKRYIQVEKGDVLNTKGEVIGEHDGSLLYTIGERHGFKIFKKTENDKPLYVVEKDLEKNVIVVDEKRLEESNSGNIKGDNLSLTYPNSVKEGDSVDIQIRYRQKPVGAVVKKIDGEYIEMESKEKIDSIAKGQSLVIYKDHECVGGAILS